MYTPFCVLYMHCVVWYGAIRSMQKGTFVQKNMQFTESRHHGLRDRKLSLPLLQSQCLGKPVHV